MHRCRTVDFPCVLFGCFRRGGVAPFLLLRLRPDLAALAALLALAPAVDAHLERVAHLLVLAAALAPEELAPLGVRLVELAVEDAPVGAR